MREPNYKRIKGRRKMRLTKNCNRRIGKKMTRKVKYMKGKEKLCARDARENTKERKKEKTKITMRKTRKNIRWRRNTDDKKR